MVKSIGEHAAFRYTLKIYNLCHIYTVTYNSFRQDGFFTFFFQKQGLKEF